MMKRIGDVLYTESFGMRSKLLICFDRPKMQAGTSRRNLPLSASACTCATNARFGGMWKSDAGLISPERFPYILN